MANPLHCPPSGESRGMPGTAESSMFAVYRTMLRHGSMYSLALFAGKLSSFLLLPVYTRYLTPTDYGVVELLDLTSFVATSLLGMRIADSMLYHYFEAETEEHRQRVLSTAFLGSLLMGALAGLLGWIAAPLLSQLVFTSKQYSPYFRIVFISVGLSLPQSVGYTYLRALNRSGLFCAATLARLVFQIGLMVLLLVYCHMGFAAMVWTALVTYGVEALLAAWIVLRPITLSLDLVVLRRITSYGAPLAIGSLGMLLLHFGDRYFLQRYVSLADVGIYALAYKIGMLVAQAQVPFMQYWNAQMFSIVQGPDGDELYTRTTTYFAVFYFFVALSLALFSLPLLHVMTTPAYYGAAAFVPLVVLAYVVRGLGDYFRSVFLLQKRTSLDGLIVTCGAVVCLLLYATLIPRLGAWGAVISTVTAFSVMLPLSVWQAQRVKRHAFEWKRIGMASIYAGALYAGGRIVLTRCTVPEVIVAAAFSLFFPLLLLSTGFFEVTELAILRRACAHVRLQFFGSRA